MKNLWILVVVAFLLGLNPAKAESSKGLVGMVEIGSLARSQGFDTENLLLDPIVWCYAKKALRINGRERIAYQNAIFYLDGAIKTLGVLYVSKDTICLQTNEIWVKEYPRSKWSIMSYYNHYPNMFKGVVYLSLNDELSYYCQVPNLQIVNYKRESEGGGYDKLSFRRVVIYISGGEYPGFRYLDRFFPKYSFSEYFISKDSKCFLSKEEAVRGGFKLLK